MDERPQATVAEETEKTLEAEPAAPTQEAEETSGTTEEGSLEQAGTEAQGQVPQDLQGANLDLMLDLPLDVTVELGRTIMQLGDALALQPGSIVELNRLPGEPLDLHVNERLVARGEVVVVNDALALRITEIIGNQPRRS